MSKSLGVVVAAAVVLAAAGCSSSSSKAAPAAATTSGGVPAPVTSGPGLTAATGSASAQSHDSDASAVVARLVKAGLPITAVAVVTAEEDGNHLLGRPGGYTSKTTFTDTRIDPSKAKDDEPGAVDLGGAVEFYPDADGAKARADYIAKAHKMAPITGTEYIYVSGTAVLRLSQALTPQQAEAYHKALGG